MPFEFATAARIIFGPGKIQAAGELARGLGKRWLVVTGRSNERGAPLFRALEAAGLFHFRFALPHEPTLESVVLGRDLAMEHHCDGVLGFGGGSAMDAAKAIAALMTNPGDPLDYIEVIGSAKALANNPAPVMTVPTTAGSGAEVTRNAVLHSARHRAKASLRSAGMLPRIALVDPELTYSLPRETTVSTGLDALTQLIEPFVSRKNNPMTDAFCREGLGRACRSLPVACREGGNAAAREEMALASLLGGLSLANAALGAVHGFAAALGGMYAAPHGEICAALLPAVMKVNLQALRARPDGAWAVNRFDELGRIFTGNPGASADDAADWVASLCAALGVKPLRSLGVPQEDFSEIIPGAARASSMKGNPIDLDTGELRQILDLAY